MKRKSSWANQAYSIWFGYGRGNGKNLVIYLKVPNDLSAKINERSHQK
jgi:hypothetical protein